MSEILQEIVAKGKTKYYAYYRCSNKECSQKGKTIARDTIEGEFTDLLRSLSPSETLLGIVKDMLRLRWDERRDDLARR
ncbi:MAG: hypothetical protein AAGK66_09365 [Pseudomonadota bacterium]